jgi:hypothetical protein
MSKVDDYRATLSSLYDWDSYLLAHSGLPGPRANLELAQAVAEQGDAARFLRYAALDAAQAPGNTPQEFLAFCGVTGLGRLLAQGDAGVWPFLRQAAADPRWRIREAVAIALQYLGEADMTALLDAMETWSSGSLFEQRAAAAALCEPRLLSRAEYVSRVIHLLDRITTSFTQISDRRSESFQALRKGLAYCWSVAVAAHPAVGKSALESWLASDDSDVRRLMRENLKKQRLARMDPEWVAGCLQQLDER